MAKFTLVSFAEECSGWPSIRGAICKSPITRHMHLEVVVGLEFIDVPDASCNGKSSYSKFEVWCLSRGHYTSGFPHDSLEHFETPGAIPKWGEPNIDPTYYNPYHRDPQKCTLDFGKRLPGPGGGWHHPWVPSRGQPEAIPGEGVGPGCRV